MMKKYEVYIIAGIIVASSIFGFSTIDGKVNEFDAKTYIGNYYEELPAELDKKGIEVSLGEDNQIEALLINRTGYTVDSIRVGDPVEKIYKVYPVEWIDTGEYTIQISYGKESHYGIVTYSITYIIGKGDKVQSILIGKTATFSDEQLPISNREAKKLLQGKWKSEYGRTIEFKDDEMNDSYMNNLWDKQLYMILSPNEFLIYREKENQTEKLKMHFWFSNSNLYLFTVNDKGLPIQESIELFFKS